MHQKNTIFLLLFPLLSTVVGVNTGGAKEPPFTSNFAARVHGNVVSNSPAERTKDAVGQSEDGNTGILHYPDLTEELGESVLPAAEVTAEGAFQLAVESYSFGPLTFTLMPSLSLFLPTGAEGPFLTPPEASFMPSLAVVLTYGRLAIHTSSGVEVNVENSQHHYMHSTAGAALQVSTRFSFFLEATQSRPLDANRTGMNPTWATFVGGFEFVLSESAVALLTTSTFSVEDRVWSQPAMIGLQFGF